MKNLKIKILIGIPASGKSTWATNFIRNNPDWIRVNRDSFRLMLRNESMCEPKIEDLITSLMDNVIYDSLKRKLNIIIDNTNVKAKYIDHIIEKFKYFADIDYQIFDISIDKAIERDKNRDAKVGDEVIRKMYKDYKILMDSFNFQPISRVKGSSFQRKKFDPDLPSCIIFDLDGTLAEMHCKRGPFDWDKVDNDDVNEIVADLIKYFHNNGRYIILLSGRSEEARQKTREWLEFYNIPYDALYMRKHNDYRRDSIVKKEIYDEHIKEKFNVLCAFDDRLQVLNMWYNEGIYTFNVNQGNIDF